MAPSRNRLFSPRGNGNVSDGLKPGEPTSSPSTTPHRDVGDLGLDDSKGKKLRNRLCVLLFYLLLLAHALAAIGCLHLAWSKQEPRYFWELAANALMIFVLLAIRYWLRRHRPIPRELMVAVVEAYKRWDEERRARKAHRRRRFPAPPPAGHPPASSG